MSFIIEHLNGHELTAVIRRAMDGDRQAYESLMRAHAEYILVSVNALVTNEQDAEEAAQDVLVIVYREIGKLSSPYAFSAWLRRIIVNTCLNYDDHAGRMRKRRANGGAQTDEPAADATGMPDEVLEKKDARDRLYGLIRRLPPSQRRCIFLRYYEDLSYREIAKLLGVHVGSVGFGIKAAKENLRKAMETSNEFDSKGRLLEGVAFGSVVKEAIEHNSGKILTKGALEKMYAKIATADSLHVSSMGQAVQANVGTSSAKAAWVAGGATAAACVALLLWHQSTLPPVQEQAPDVSAPTATVIMKDTQYQADAAVISFETTNPPDGVDDPTGARIAVNDDEGTPTEWSIRSGSGAEAASGSGSEAVIPPLAPGRYVITWDVVGNGDAVSVVSREFYVN